MDKRGTGVAVPERQGGPSRAPRKGLRSTDLERQKMRRRPLRSAKARETFE